MFPWAADWVADWASYYANHAVLRTLLEFLHVGGLLAGGGIALAADRVTLRSRHQPPAERAERLRGLHGTHGIVLAGLGLVVVSGLLLLLADTETYLHSRVFWSKMGLFVLLMANGWLLVRAEKQAEAGQLSAWPRLTATSVASIILWFLTTLAGAALPNIG